MQTRLLLKTACISAGLSGDFVQPPDGFLLLAVWAPGLQLLEEVVALVIYENECREVLNGDFPDGFHTQFGVFHALDALDAALREHCCHAADGAEVEAAVLLAGIGYDL